MSTILRETVNRGDDQVDILIEVDEAPSLDEPYSYGNRRGTRGDAKGLVDGGEVATRAFEKGMALIRDCAEQVAETVRRVSEAARPEEVEVKFGVKLVGQVGAMIAKTGAEGQMEVTLRWKIKEGRA